jgi:hypothetical protein
MFKMTASAQEKALCVLEFAKTTSVSSVQWHFRTHYGKNPPTRKFIYDWWKQFQGKGCLCKGKSTGRPQVSFSNKTVPLPECQPPTSMDWTCCERRPSFVQMAPQVAGSDRVTSFCGATWRMLCLYPDCQLISMIWSGASLRLWLLLPVTCCDECGKSSIIDLTFATSHVVRCENNFESSPFSLYIARHHMFNSTCKINFRKFILLFWITLYKRNVQLCPSFCHFIFLWSKYYLTTSFTVLWIDALPLGQETKFYTHKKLVQLVCIF